MNRVFRLPIPGKPAVTMFLPEDLSRGDWSLIDRIVTAWLQRMHDPTPPGEAR